MKNEQFEPWENDTYRTGSTTPPKSYSGLVAVLLVLVIFLAGLVSILSVWNIKLFSAFHQLQHSENVPLELEAGESQENGLLTVEEEPLAVSDNKSIGIGGDQVTSVYQQHFQLPEGLYITRVEENSTADHQGLQVGDVLISIDKTPITEISVLTTLLEQKKPGDQCNAVIYRRDTDQEFTVTLTIEQTP